MNFAITHDGLDAGAESIVERTESLLRKGEPLWRLTELTAELARDREPSNEDFAESLALMLLGWMRTVRDEAE